MDSVITFLNTISKSFVDFSTSMLIQSSLLIAILLVLNIFLRKKVRVVFLYGIWILVLIKLVLPTTFSSPTGLGYLVGDKVPGVITEKVSSIPKQISSFLKRIKPARETMPYGMIVTDLSLIGTSPGPIINTSAQLTTAPSEATASLSWQSFAFFGWLTIVAVMVLLLIWRMFLLRRLLAQSKNPNDLMKDIFERCRKEMDVHRPILLRLSPVTASPSVCGLFRPTILIPQNLLRKLKADDLRSVFLHELAHIKRGDLWINLVQTILQIAYFYNPLLWMANVTIRKVREQAVDEMVLVAMGEQAEDYPETLLNISRMTFGRPALNLRLIGVVESKKALERRIMNMLDRPVPKSSKLGCLGLIAIVVIGSVILPMGYNPTGQFVFAASINGGGSVGGIIIPGERVGDYTFDMSKDDVLERFGKPRVIFYGENKYTLDNLPEKYYMPYDGISFHIVNGSVRGITALSPLFQFANGLKVGDSEQKVKEIFGDDFRIREFDRKDFLFYKDKGLMFEIDKKDRTVMEINVSPIESKKSYEKTDFGDKLIVPGVRVGDYIFGMSKDDVLESFGKPRVIFYGENRYTLDNFPERYYMPYGDISFFIDNGSVKGITALSPSYRFANGLKVGDSEQKVKEAFGDDFKIREFDRKDFLFYKDKGLMFEINKKDRTVMEINVSPVKSKKSYKKTNFGDKLIVPGVRVGDYTFDMRKDDVLKNLGEPRVIFYGENRYTLDNLPEKYYMPYGDVSFFIDNGSVREITALSPSYRFADGLRVGDSEQKVKEIFSDDYRIREFERRDFLSYEDKGLMFEINKKDRTVMEINVSPFESPKS